MLKEKKNYFTQKPQTLRLTFILRWLSIIGIFNIITVLYEFNMSDLYTIFVKRRSKFDGP